MIYKRQKSSPCKLVVILSMAIFFGLLLISPSDRNEEAIPENITEGTGRQGSMISKNGVSQDRVITWMRNRTLSPWESSILTQQERIYFHETTGHESLNLRQLCAVESAAKNNPDRSVQIFLQSDRVSLSGPLELVLKTYTNVVIVLINASDYFAETPLESWYLRGKWRVSPYKTEHFSDYIRILSLYKGGGMYMDLDFVTLKPFDRDVFWNFVPEEDDAVLTGSSFHFERDHPIIRKMLTYLSSSYRPKEWTYSGPAMIKHVVLRYCQKTSPKPTYPRALCPGVRVLPKRFLYPYKYGDWKHYFRTDISAKDKAFASHAVHVYNKLSKNEPIYVGSTQIYSLMARDHCPLTYAHAVDSF